MEGGGYPHSRRRSGGYCLSLLLSRDTEDDSGSAGHLTTTTTYSFLTVVALGLVVGTGGSAFLSAMRDKATSMITATQAQGQTAAMKQTAIAGMRPLVTMASSITHVGAASITAQTSGVAEEQFLTLADRLPPSLGDQR